MTPFLVAVPLAMAGLWWAARGSGVELSRGRRLASFLLRSFAVLAMGGALGRPALSVPGERPWLTVFVADVSDSVPAAAWTGALDHLRAAWDRERALGNRCALVAFAGRAETLQPPGSGALELEPWRLAHRAALEAARGDAARLTEIETWRDLLHVSETRPGEGVRAARALFQDGAASRLVILSDGRLPVDDPLPAGASVVSLESGPRRDLAVIDVHAPTAVRGGEPFDIRVTLDAGAPAEATLTLSIDDRGLPGASRKVKIDRPGRSVVVIPDVQPVPALTPGLHRVLVVAAVPGDDETRNNAGGAAFTTTGKPKVLLLEGRPADGEFLARIFTGQDVDVVRESPAAVKSASLEEYSVVVMAGVPRSAVPLELQTALLSYVERSGGGLWMMGGAALAGPEGWAGSPLERILPVAFEAATSGTSPRPPTPAPPTPPAPPPPPAEADPPGEVKRVLAPAVAVLFVVDKSGSMAGPPIEIVKAAVVESSKTLTPKDLVGVIAFDAKPRWILEFTEGGRTDYVQDRVGRLFADGFTSIYPGLAEARRAFQADGRAQRCSAKHVVLLSDGDTAPGDFETLALQMRAEGISITAVCVGSAPKFEPALMSQIADWGGGRFIFTTSFKNIPMLFAQEVARVLGPIQALRQPPPAAPPKAPPTPAPGPTTPPLPAPIAAPARLAVVAKDAHEALQGVDTAALPGLFGRLDAALRTAPGAAAPLVFADGKPLLATTRAGLGKSAVWTSDLGSPWSRDWIAWKDTGKLAVQVLRSLSAAPPDVDFAARVRVGVGARGVRVRVDPGPPEETLTAVDPETREALPLLREADGGAGLDLSLERTGELKRILIQRRDGPSALLGAVRTTEEEFLPSPPFAGGARALDWEALEGSLSGAQPPAERKADLTPWLAALAALLLAADLAVRRYAA